MKSGILLDFGVLDGQNPESTCQYAKKRKIPDSQSSESVCTIIVNRKVKIYVIN